LLHTIQRLKLTANAFWTHYIRAQKKRLVAVNMSFNSRFSILLGFWLCQS